MSFSSWRYHEGQKGKKRIRKGYRPLSVAGKNLALPRRYEHGAGGRSPLRSLRDGLNCIVARPTGRGPGSVYQNYGEVDVLETIDHLASHYPVDRDRISVTGRSMGGAATWYLASHYPDLFSAAAPICGYCDYRLWEKPGGLTFHMHPWEEPSWTARSAIFLAENFIHTPLWIIHGEWDRSVGGGVPVAHSIRMAAELERLGYRYTYTEAPKAGHHVPVPDEVIPWLLEQRKERNPGRVSFSTYELRHNSSHWIGVEQLETYGKKATVDASLDSGDCIRIDTKNIQTITVGPAKVISGAKKLVLDGIDLPAENLSRSLAFSKTSNSGAWVEATGRMPTQKRHNSSGPFGDLFFNGLVIVPGEAGTEEETHFNESLARNSLQHFNMRNGGVHRGGILGENTVDLPIIPDHSLPEELSRSKNLLLFGTFLSNAVLKRYEGKLPIAFGPDTISLCGRTFKDEHAAIIAIFPHPENPERYVAVHGGLTPDATTWGSHLDMQLLPDYLVYSRGEVIEWGFWNNDWL